MNIRSVNISNSTLKALSPFALVIAIVSLSASLNAEPTSGASKSTSTAQIAKPVEAPAPVSSVKNISVKNIEVIHESGGVRVRVHVTERTRFTHEIVPAKGDKSYRIVLDIQGANHRLGELEFTSLPNSVVSSIRTSQFSVKPNRVCRIVLDLKKEAFYKTHSSSKYIDLFVTDATVQPFASWSSASYLADKKATANKVKKAAATRTLASSGVTDDVDSKVSAKKVAPAKSVASTISSSTKGSSVKSSSAKIPSTKSSSPTVAKSVEDKKAMIKKTVKKTVKKPTVKSYKPTVEYSALEPDNSQVKDKSVAKNIKVVKKSAKSAAKVSDKKGQPCSPLKSNNSKSSTAVKKQAKKLVSSSNKTIARVEKSGKTLAPTVVAKKAKSSAKSSKSTKAGSSVVALADKSSKSKESDTKAISEKSKQKSKAKVAKKAEPNAVASKVVPSKSKSSSEAKAAKKAKKKSDPGYSAKFRRSVDKRAIKLKGTLVAEFPKRLTIKYKSRGTRDPFASLFRKKSSKDKSDLDSRPNVESLTMVGVLKNIDGRTRGLFEDLDGRGYILAKGDRIENGSVIKITKAKAYFQIFEYGWSRTVALSLEG